MKHKTMTRAAAVALACASVLPSAAHAQDIDAIFRELSLFTGSLAITQSAGQTSDLSLLTGSAASEASIGANEQEKVLLQHLYAQLGKPYVYGAYGPDSFDCSGLIYYTFGLMGKAVPRTAKTQSEGGVMVERSALQIGDLVFFDTRNTENLGDIKIDTTDVLALFADEVNETQSKGFTPQLSTHSGVYVGDGKFIHASSGSVMKVVLEDLDAKYFAQRYLYAKRY